MIGRLIVTVSLIVLIIFPWLVWVDEHHFAAPEWPEHAKSHLIWSWVVCTIQGLAGLYLTIFHWRDSHLARIGATYLAAMIWFSKSIETLLAPLLVIKATATHFRTEVVFGYEQNVFLIGMAGLVPVIGYYLDVKERAKQHLL